ncbi:MAG: aminotransferase class III-fold pyridoxal phosphate-dependent enzyme [Singulisphaera sp.]|nr:aminotransferase class III-fold pyridoxal phosphate-dependent enzyme [Singulisphaera sp.]
MSHHADPSGPMSVVPDAPEGRPEGTAEIHPFARHVNPHLADLLAALRLDKRYVRGEGCDLYDHAGRRYLDCIAAYGALPFGYNPPAIWRALRGLRARGEPSFVQPSLLEAAGQLAERLVALAPEGLSRVTFANSGAEAVEAAIKLCRAATGRLGILSTQGSFHGKTLGALSATGNPDYQDGFGAPATAFDQIPFGDVAALRRALADRPGHYAAFLVEPIQGEGGIVEPPPGYLAEARVICREAGVLLALDEIQSGLGRTGDLFACEAEGVVPDVMMLAKALGGGLVPIGAVLCTEEAYTSAFARKHSSTFAGNALACRAGLATLERLTRDDGRLLRQVARNGRRLKRRLEALAARHPHLIAEVRGRGYMLGLRFAVDRDLWPESLLGTAAEQGFFTPIFASYLLNVEGVRVAPTLNGNSVIRIEPPLTFRWRHCEQLLGALERALEAFSRGETGRILKAILEGEPQPPSTSMGGPSPMPRIDPVEGETRFAFLIHPLDVPNYADFDPSLATLGHDDLGRVMRDVATLIDPFVFSRARVTSRTGQAIYGEFITLAWTAAQMAEMPRHEAAAGVRAALALARSRGAQLVGLGAFTSVVTRGGLDVAREGVPVTTGNSYTAVSAAQAVAMALRALGTGFGPHTGAAIVGGSGSIGRAMALLLAEDVGRLVLIGNPDRTAAVARRRLLAVAGDVCRHLAVRSREGFRFAHGSLGSRLLATGGGCPDPDAPADLFLELAARLERAGAFLLTNAIDEVLPLADLVVAATSATNTLIGPRSLRPGAVVCDLSRPANVSAEVAATRPDVLVIDGGVIDLPGRQDIGRFGLGRGQAYACMAETMMLTLAGHLRNTSLGTDLAPEVLRMLRALADRHGFRVAQLRSFGRPLDRAAWDRLLVAREQALAAWGRRTA